MPKSTTVNKNTLLLFLNKYVFSECIPKNVDYLSADQVFTYKSTMNVTMFQQIPIRTKLLNITFSISW